MAPKTEKHKPRWRQRINVNNFGLAMLALAYALSIYRVFAVRGHIADPNIVYVRIAHWQLESGYREAMDDAIREYEKIHPDVKIIQMANTERIYPQWLNTQFQTGEAPDIAEIGMAQLTWDDAVARYFMPLTEIINEPNPYNRGTTLEAVPWRETFVDGMRSRFCESLQEYFSVPTTLYPRRLYFNKRLLAMAEKLLLREPVRNGRSCQWAEKGDPPPTLDDLLRLCEVARTMPSSRGTAAAKKLLIREYEQAGKAVPSWMRDSDMCENLEQFDEINAAVKRLIAAGEREAAMRITPISGSNYSLEFFLDAYKIPFTHVLATEADIDISGETDLVESYLAYDEGKWSMRNEHVRAWMKCMKAISAYFPEGGFGAYDRDQMIFNFVQGQAMLVATGSWDAAAIFQSPFDVGVMDFPMPAKDGEWGRYICGRGTEAAAGGLGPYGVYKFSRNRDKAVDFLQFLTSQKMNGRFNAKATLVPVVIGTEVPERMRPFLPDPNGYSQWIELNKGDVIQGRWLGAVQQYLQGEIEYEQSEVRNKSKDGVVQLMDKVLRDPLVGGDDECSRNYELAFNSSRDLDRTVAANTAIMLMGRDADAVVAARSKYVRSLLTQSLWNNGEYVRRNFERVRKTPIKRKS